MIQVSARGVDSVGPGFSDPAAIVRSLAKREREIIRIFIFFRADVDLV